jgi:signal transduction histidine kinase
MPFFELLTLPENCEQKKFEIKVNQNAEQENEEDRLIVEVKTRTVMVDDRESTLVLINDISKLLLAEKINSSQKYKDLMIATTSHELKTPLNSIINMLDLISDALKEEQDIEYLEVAQSSSKMMLSLVHDILDYS